MLNDTKILFISHHHKDHAELQSLQDLIRRYQREHEYKEKINKYNRIHDKVQIRLEDFKAIIFPGGSVDRLGNVSNSLHRELIEVDRLQRFSTILKQLLTLASKTINDYKENTEFLFKTYEAVIHHEYGDLLAQYDEKPRFDIYNWIVSRQRELKDKIHYLNARRKHLLKKLYSRVKRDIRQIIRRIHQFLFKNMDDEAHVINVVYAPLIITLNNPSIHNSGKETNNRAA